MQHTRSGAVAVLFKGGGMRIGTGILAAVLLAGVSDLAAGDGIAWRVSPDFSNDEAAEEISGAVCAGDEGAWDWCVAVNDEKKYVQFFSIDGQTIVPGKRARVLEKKGAAGKRLGEPDLEAVASDGGFVYLAGSHGVGRRTGRADPERYFVFRFPVDRESGKPAFEITRDRVADRIERSAGLKSVIELADRLGDFANQPLDANGANIEGMTALPGRLFFGFRAPVLPDGAVVLEVTTDRLFGGDTSGPITHILDLGAGYGIRDMARIGNDVLILTGAGTGDELVPAIWRWRPGHAPRLLQILTVPAGWKAEGLMVLSADNRTARTLVFFDGQKNGAPIEFEIPTR